MQLDGSTQLCSILKASDFFRAMSNRAFPYVLDDPYEETGEVSSSKGTGKGKKGKKGKKGGLPNAAGGSSASGKGKPGAGNVAEDEEGKGRKGYEEAKGAGKSNWALGQLQRMPIPPARFYRYYLYGEVQPFGADVYQMVVVQDGQVFCQTCKDDCPGALGLCLCLCHEVADKFGLAG